MKTHGTRSDAALSGVRFSNLPTGIQNLSSTAVPIKDSDTRTVGWDLVLRFEMTTPAWQSKVLGCFVDEQKKTVTAVVKAERKVDGQFASGSGFPPHEERSITTLKNPSGTWALEVKSEDGRLLLSEGHQFVPAPP